MNRKHVKEPALNGDPTKIIPVVPQSQNEKRRYKEANGCRKMRLANRS